MESPTRTLIIAEAAVYCDALKVAFASDPSIKIIGSATTLADALAIGANGSVEVVAMQLPYDAGLAFATRMQARFRDARVVVFGVPRSERQIVAWVRAGVTACLSAEAGLPELSRAIRAAARGESTCSSVVTTALLRQVKDSAVVMRTELVGILSDREFEVLSSMAEGLSNKQIASALQLQVPTVKNHVQRIYRKLGVHRRREAIAEFMTLQ